MAQRVQGRSGNRLPHTRRLVALAVMAVPALPAWAANDLYWDVNGQTANSGTTATGNWNGSTANWNTDPNGANAGTTTATVNNTNDVHFASGSGHTGTYTATVVGNQSVNTIFFEEGNVTIGGTASITVSAVTFQDGGATVGQSVINAPLVLGATTLTLSGLSGSNRNLNVNGGITGTGDVTINIVGGNNKITIGGAGLNNSGAVRVGGTNGGTAQAAGITGVIGPNVTGLFMTAPFGANTPNGLLLGAANTFSGPTSITSSTAGGFILLGNALALQNSTVSPTGIANGLRFNTGIGAFTLGGLGGSSSLALMDNAVVPLAVTVQVGNNNTSASYSGVLSGGGSLVKIGNATQTLSGNSTFSGGATVSAGTLHVTGSINNSAVVVETTGTLSGTGSTGAITINAGGTVNPGASAGTLAAAGATLNGGGQYRWEINAASTTFGTGKGASYDWLNLTGGLDLTNLDTGDNQFVIDVSGLNGSSPGIVSGFDNQQEYFWILATASGGIAGFNTGKFTVNSSAFAVNNPLGDFGFTVLQGGGENPGTANDLLLHFSAVPEPGTAGCLLAGAVVLMSRRRRKLG